MGYVLAYAGNAYHLFKCMHTSSLSRLGYVQGYQKIMKLFDKFWEEVLERPEDTAVDRKKFIYIAIHVGKNIWIL